MNKNLFRRIGITLLCLFGTIVLVHIPLPFIKYDSFYDMNLTHFSVGLLGLRPYIFAYIFLWIFTMIIPAWRKRWQEKNRKIVFFHYVLMLITLIISMLQAFQFSSMLIQTDRIELGFMSVIISVILVTGVFAFIGAAVIINRIGVGQGFSLIFCVGIFKHIINLFINEVKCNADLIPVFLTVGFLLVLTIFFVWVINIKWSFGSVNKKSIIPFSVVGLFPSKVFGLVMLIPLFLNIINPEWVIIFIKTFYLPFVYLPISFIFCLIVSFLYLRRLMIKLSRIGETISEVKLWKWTILWTLFFVLISHSYYLLMWITKSKHVLNSGIASAQIFVLVVTAITFFQQWRCRNWKTVFSHSDPIQVYVKAAELQQDGKDVCVVPTEGLGAAYGFLVGRLAERFVLTKD